MGLYERRMPRTASMDAYETERDARDYHSSVSRSLRPPEASGRPSYSSSPSFPRSSFTQEAGRRHVSPGGTQDRTAAADNLLSLIQSVNPGRKPAYEQSRRDHAASSHFTHMGRYQRLKDEFGNTSEDVTPPATAEEPMSRGRKRLEPPTSPKKRRVGRPAKYSYTEDDDDNLKRKRRDKKPTYIVRKEKKAMLEAELVELKQRVVQLRRASGIPDSFFAEKEQLLSKIHDNNRLRTEARKQDLLLRNAHAIMASEYLMKCSESPIENFIHLTTDLKQRRAALVNLKETKLKQADDFITERSKVMPQVTPWCQESKFETEEGHFCAEKMDNTPFHGVRSVRQVFEALQFFFRNMEISISEMLGDITVREDDDSTASDAFSNHRLVSTMSHGVKVEKNIVKFFKLVEPEHEGQAPYALVATDSVDLDDMYPYVPQERIRMDINAAMKFTEHFCKIPPNRKTKTRTRHPLYGSGGFPYPRDPEEDQDDEYERVVVLTRFFRVKLHHTEMDIPPHVLQEVRQGLACFSDTMVQSMHRVIYESR
ncbi:hypothetical protein, variant 2 [Phytophthora nicotianae INRA-310]|uniref:Uncharacterized protein n=1 Tax=Phytophthora nicotianae (strain INRA-310) TaxID=761204 RepID=W2PL17_PHYN3|nr:hypothetical protein PPTG_17020 [Phytophthora nicotianae INRA-310]XP_008913102.1 hypothetical protein, variant 1 [Phytophthora nicotianae INRA-310]XP_008913103.1 hypothetical protein, variant 2 [Phytophthora nicotianae INRA-310]ETN01555.1 hypothetical protein PPTG_17020 [Phytophthora nicotianae INRA-310]ETN01556.1 hypothetical protein, variant 1 [Phytophthora nicotianae INRA-310]ETN01557.1 hypothetical protein, variant 2 [Phytophthora nicotianae INRA-310]